MNDHETEAARNRAYQIWEAEGRPHGRDADHWQQALAELGLAKPYDEVRESIAVQTREWDAAEEDQ